MAPKTATSAQIRPSSTLPPLDLGVAARVVSLVATADSDATVCDHSSTPPLFARPSQERAVSIFANGGKGAFPARRPPVGTSAQRQIQLSIICSNPAACSEGTTYRLSCADRTPPSVVVVVTRSPRRAPGRCRSLMRLQTPLSSTLPRTPSLGGGVLPGRNRHRAPPRPPFPSAAPIPTL